MAISVSEHPKMAITEDPIAGLGNTGAGAASRPMGLGIAPRVLNATSAPPTGVPVSLVWQDRVTLIAGAKTLDFTALARVGFTDDLDATGLKLQRVQMKAVGTNSNPLTITFGAADPYPIFGVLGVVELLQDGELTFAYEDDSPDVSATVKDVDFAGTGTEAVDVVLVFG